MNKRDNRIRVALMLLLSCSVCICGCESGPGTMAGSTAQQASSGDATTHSSVPGDGQGSTSESTGGETPSGIGNDGNRPTGMPTPSCDGRDCTGGEQGSEQGTEQGVAGQAAPAPAPAPAPDPDPQACAADGPCVQMPNTQAPRDACTEAEQTFESMDACEQAGAGCHEAADGSYCLPPEAEPCPVGFARVPDGMPCNEQDGCFFFDEGINCAPASQ